MPTDGRPTRLTPAHRAWIKLLAAQAVEEFLQAREDDEKETAPGPAKAGSIDAHDTVTDDEREAGA